MKLHELREAVFHKTPVFKKIIETHKNTPLLDYFSTTNSPPHTPESRQQELCEVVRKMMVNLIDPTIVESVIRQLRAEYYVSTADHHGPITHPFFVNSHLIQSYANQKKEYQNIIVFSCSGISLNNSSFPRGILFHDTELKKKRLRFTSLNYRHCPVYGFPAYTKTEFHARLVKEYADSGKTDKKNLKNLVEEIYEHNSVKNDTWYSEQISRTNYLLWKKIPGQEHMNLVYLAQEDVVSELLTRYHFNTDTIITRLLTDEAVLSAFEQHFDGIRGAVDTENDKGTTLFWAIHEGKRKQLKRFGKILKTSDGSYEIILTKNTLHRALEKKEIMPSMALSFIVLSFYYGLNCGGGFLQVNYLTHMKQSYIELLKKIGNSEEISGLKFPQTDLFRGELVFATMSNALRNAHASSIDLILYGDSKTDARLQELARVCTLGSAVDEMMPEFYKILYGKEAVITEKIPSIEPIIYV